MAKITDTYARAYESCDAILQNSGKFPTIDAVRALIGVNSPNTIKSAINAWTQAFAEKHYQKLHRPELPTALLDSAEQVWKLAVIEAEKAYHAKEKRFLDENSELKAAMAQQQQEIADYRKGLAKALALLEQANQKAADMQQAMGEMESALKDRTHEVGLLNAKIQELNDKHLEERLVWEETRNKDQDWFARRLDEEKGFAEERWQEKFGRQAETIRSLRESEEMLRQSAYTLRSENTRLTQGVAELELQLATSKQKQTDNAPFKKRIGERRRDQRGPQGLLRK